LNLAKKPIVQEWFHQETGGVHRGGVLANLRHGRKDDHGKLREAVASRG
jgi:hypothetical protein